MERPPPRLPPSSVASAPDASMTTTLQLLLTLAGIHPAPIDSPPPLMVPPAPQQVRAVRLSQPVTIDGELNEPFWLSAERVTGFVQRDPTEGAVATESTVVYLAYDDAALYIGARLYDARPDSVVARLARHTQYVWGINFRRDIARKNEFDYLVYTPKNGSGFVSRFPDLVGIERIDPPRRIEVMPYMTSRAAFTPHAAGDPFNDGSKL